MPYKANSTAVEAAFFLHTICFQMFFLQAKPLLDLPVSLFVMEQSSTFSRYRDRILATLPERSELNWLHVFFNQTTRKVTGTRAYICEMSNPFVVQEFKDCVSLQSSLVTGRLSPDAASRLVIIHYEDVDAVDRDVIDIVADHFDIDPYTLMDHFREFKSDIYDLEAEWEAITGKLTAGPQDIWPNGGLFNSRYIFRPVKSAVLSFFQTGVYVSAARNQDLKNTVLFIREDPVHTSHYLALSSPVTRLRDRKANIRFEAVTLKKRILRTLEAAIQEKGVSKATSYDDVLPVVVEAFVSIAFAHGQKILRRAISVFSDDYESEELNLFDIFWRLLGLRHQMSGIEISRSRAADCASFGKALQNLDFLCQSLKEVRGWRDAQKQIDHNAQSSGLMSDQLTDARKSIKTSTQIGQLSRLAYIFLPLQLTTSILGMNLKVFGSGTLALSTFVTILSLLGALAIFPVLLPVWLSETAITRTISIRPYSVRMSFIFAAFCLTHSDEDAQSLWSDTGLQWEIQVHQGEQKMRRRIGGEGWARGRKKLARRLKTETNFGSFWCSRLATLYRIIDDPARGLPIQPDPDGQPMSTQATSEV